ncbi:hypothetical protein OnM2_097019 [Erysiphe neolycopersici]|uniref:Uncharacterized protein n=1 Tax=Erysiphe neolycopersici TaxID=212602 RepID=A0A420HAK1_9PEZI|nr:hypothetical protein OnM2_097019 [Erysiphe neolycopersici]
MSDLYRRMKNHSIEYQKWNILELLDHVASVIIREIFQVFRARDVTFQESVQQTVEEKEASTTVENIAEVHHDINISNLTISQDVQQPQFNSRSARLFEESSQVEYSNVTPETNSSALSTIQMCLDDGSLLQVKHIIRAHDIWKALENLYCASGFSSEFILCREFFETKLSNFNTMEEYLNRIKQLNDDLKAKDMQLPRQMLFAWILNNLSPDYRPLVSIITQSLRNNKKAFTIETLFANLLDEANRLHFEEINNNQILYSSTNNTKFNKNQNNKNKNTNQNITRQYKGKKPFKITRGNIVEIVKKYPIIL